MNKSIYLIAFLFLFSCNQSSKTEKLNPQEKQESNVELIEQLESSETIETETEKVEITGETTKEEPCDSTKCDINLVLTIYENLDNLTRTNVDDFLRTLNNCCSNNVEFIEFSNEMLFKVLLKRPDLFLASYKDQVDKLDTAWINSELQSPLHDLIPLKDIIAIIDSVDFDTRTKEIVLMNF